MIPNTCYVISGYYDLYWAANGVSTTVAIGVVQGGLKLIQTRNVDMITGDEYGPNTVVDMIYRGGSVMLEFTLQEIKRDSCQSLLSPFTITSSVPYWERMGVPGTVASLSFAGTLEAIPRVGTPAASFYASGGNGWRFRGANIAPYERPLDTGLHAIPIRFQCLPFEDAGDSSIVKVGKRITAANA